MKKTLLFTAALLCCHAQAQAGAFNDGNLSISGFGTLGVAKSDTDQAQFVRYNQAVGVRDKFRIGLDSNLGLQASYQFNDWLSATTQVLTRKNTSPSFTTELTWAFLKMKVNDEVNVRVGRVVIPAFLISDYQNVGYANTMMRPPIEIYGRFPLEGADGADFNYQHAFGNTNFTAQALMGVSSGKQFVPVGTGLTAHYRAPMAGLSLAVEHGPFTVRFGHILAKVEVNDLTPVNSLTDTISAIGFPQLARDLTYKGGKKLAFSALGATMDWNNIVVQAEYVQRRAKEPVLGSDSNAWCVMAGYRFGKVLPYYAHASAGSAGNSVTVPANFPKTGQLAGAVANLLSAVQQDSDMIGVRWDFAKSIALKVQVDRVRPKAASGALIYGPPTGIKGAVTVVGASLDFVF